MATTAAFPATESVGITIDGKFPLLRWLGGTEQSSVFLTRLEGDPAQKAVIKFSPANALDGQAWMGEKARNLSHPNLMRVFHSGRWKGDTVDRLYVVTEYADEILSDILRSRRLTRDEAREMLEPVMDALDWLHGQNLVHGHLKPSNIMVAGERLKISSDRLHVHGKPGWTSTSSGKYDAPEANLLAMSPAADVWSLGMVLVEALTQAPPRWDGLGDPVIPPSIPAPLSGIARECLRVDPAHRATLRAVRDALDPALVPAPPERTSSRFRLPATIAAGVLVAGGIATALFIGFHHRTSSPAVVPTAVPTAVAPVQVSPHPAVAAPPPVAAASALPRPKVEARAASLVKSVVADQRIPDVPEHIRDGIQGHIRVGIAVEVDAEGRVANATVDSPGPSRYFAKQALDAAKAWTFRAAQVDGRPVPSRWMLQFLFGQTGTTVNATETNP